MKRPQAFKHIVPVYIRIRGDEHVAVLHSFLTIRGLLADGERHGLAASWAKMSHCVRSFVSQ